MRGTRKGELVSASSYEGELLSGPRGGRRTRTNRQHMVGMVYWVTNFAGIVLLVGLCLVQPEGILSAAPKLVPWIAMVAVANLLPVSGWYSTSLAPDLPIAVAANSFRIVGTGLLVQYWDPGKAEGFFHLFSGWLIFVISLLMLFLCHRVMRLFWPPGEAHQ